MSWMVNRLIEAALTVFAGVLQVVAWAQRGPRT